MFIIVRSDGPGNLNNWDGGLWRAASARARPFETEKLAHDHAKESSLGHNYKVIPIPADHPIHFFPKA